MSLAEYSAGIGEEISSLVHSLSLAPAESPLATIPNGSGVHTPMDPASRSTLPTAPQMRIQETT